MKTLDSLFLFVWPMLVTSSLSDYVALFLHSSFSILIVSITSSLLEGFPRSTIDYITRHKNSRKMLFQLGVSKSSDVENISQSSSTYERDLGQIQGEKEHLEWSRNNLHHLRLFGQKFI